MLVLTDGVLIHVLVAIGNTCSYLVGAAHWGLLGGSKTWYFVELLGVGGGGAGAARPMFLLDQGHVTVNPGNYFQQPVLYCVW